MHLSPDDIAIAEGCGVTFILASPAQVQRFVMQRKIFYADGQALLATRSGGLYETAGTLQQLIKVGRQEQRDLAAWQHGGAGEKDEGKPSAALAPGNDGRQAEPRADLPSGQSPHPAAELLPDERPRRRERQRRPRAAPLEHAAESLAEPPQEPEGSMQVTEPAVPQPVVEVERPTQRGARWLVAGAARRGRAGKHWSTRQR